MKDHIAPKGPCCDICHFFVYLTISGKTAGKSVLRVVRPGDCRHHYWDNHSNSSKQKVRTRQEKRGAGKAQGAERQEDVRFVLCRVNLVQHVQAQICFLTETSHRLLWCCCISLWPSHLAET